MVAYADAVRSWLPSAQIPVAEKLKVLKALGCTVDEEVLRGLHGGHEKKVSHGQLAVRPMREEDRSAVLAVCLQTGDAGADATTQFPNYPELLGDRWAAPYCLTPGTVSFVLEDDGGVCGYVLAALDSESFYRWLRSEYAPRVAQRYPGPDAEGLTDQERELIAELRSPCCYLTPELQEKYPSHLHIDLAPRAQGQGLGSRMMDRLLDALRRAGSRGVHLEAHPDNARALGFYTKKHGFGHLPGRPGGGGPVYLGLSLV
eukprot:TRINITY_DN26056_c0_g1_i1.p1 TRINITY_DN26056_c0_g1~~TRINITY_DN26056_c0_g1_i1.p1  ORF type:complete len:285 (+),score=70.35 TRINITY_DN26056_c0_g1_i1:81-857(+)